jgi:hypothetical protein
MQLASHLQVAAVLFADQQRGSKVRSNPPQVRAQLGHSRAPTGQER